MFINLIMPDTSISQTPCQVKKGPWASPTDKYLISRRNSLDDLNKKFNLVVSQPDQVNALSTEVLADNAKRDFTQARAAQATNVKVISEAVETLGALAAQSQDVNYYLALATLSKAVTDASSTMLRLHRQLQDLDAPDSNKAGGPAELHNHLHFPSMSTNDLKEALKTLKNEKPDD